MTQNASKLEGKMYGALLAVAPTTQRNHNKTIMWLCKCTACGLDTTVSSTKLKSGEAKSCGCLEHVRAARSEKGHSGFNALFSNYKHAAKSRSISFELTADEFKALVTADCTYCGAIPVRVTYGSLGAKKEHGKFISNGVDRVNNTLGYIVSNCVPACRACNIAKSEMTYGEFTSWIKRVYKHINQ